MRKFAKYWRDSASLLILARDGNQAANTTKYNYKVLVFKRTEKTAFLPNSIVFPGGAFDKQDEDPSWRRVFNRMGIPDELLLKLTRVAGSRPFIFNNDSKEVLDRNISLRLTALREAFEEMGVLFGLEKEQAGATPNGYSNAVKVSDTASWQTSIHNNEKPFSELFEKLDIVPDLFNMYEWSVWLTPALFRKRRFETAFYLIALDEMPPVLPEAHEVDSYFWDTPADLLLAHKEEKIWLAPPQFYELTRLSHLYDIDDVVNFGKNRNYKGSTLLCPVQYFCSDATVFVLPGDDQYPNDYDYVTAHDDLEKYKDLTAEQFRSQAKNLHRAEHSGLHKQTYYVNITPFNGHLSVNGKNMHLSKL
ncbi:acyl-coenzyme A diphosphatase NUDT19-like [Topomyia yanbarensis]|uniref:acyl-coenzyme A diphosphatase NUDT19-like n=1 Tax=Topomyia yanbarensis TaxID=2498891 RepID=UPI00273CD4E7|nr:acyl-coenzyme A diphosphatase NUDT19-like [Topomyia yanbarensis]